MIPQKIEKIRNDRTASSNVPDLPGVYKWWCTRETLLMFLRQISSYSNRSGITINSNEDTIISQIEKIYFDDYNEYLYCFYVGKADKSLKERIIKNHIKLNAYGSTLRLSIYSLKYGHYDHHNPVHKQEEKRYVNEILDKVFVEWQECNPEDVNKNEIREINSHLRIFNLDKGDLDNTIYPNDVELREQILSNLSYARSCKNLSLI